jgi:hypothetical protein
VSRPASSFVEGSLAAFMSLVSSLRFVRLRVMAPPAKSLAMASRLA